MLKEKKRIDEFDIAKGIAIIAMIIGHLGMKHVNMIVYSFHMPLFFILSGYFLSAKDTFCHFTKKKFIGLIVPYYMCAGIICLSSIFTNIFTNHFVDNLQTSFQTYDITTWVTALLYGAGSKHLLHNGIISIGGIWFLQALFIASILVKLLDILISSKHEYIKATTIILLAIASYMSAKHIWRPLNIQTGLFSAVYVYLGYFLKQHFNYAVIKEKYLMNIKVTIAFFVLVDFNNIIVIKLFINSLYATKVNIMVVINYLALRLNQY